jgi:hypothetical protein
MNLYLVTETNKENLCRYGGMSSAVVAARDADDAKTVGLRYDGEEFTWSDNVSSKPENLNVDLIGVASESVQRGCICCEYIPCLR